MLLPARPAPANPKPAPRRHKVVVPVRYGAWLTGDLGRNLEGILLEDLGSLGDVAITRLPRSFVVEAAEEPGPLVEAVHRAIHRLEAAVQRTYPVFHHQFGPVWAGTLQAVFA